MTLKKNKRDVRIQNIGKEKKGHLLSFIQFKQGSNGVVSVVRYNYSFQILYT